MRKTFLQYGKQTIEEDDIQAMVDVLREDKYLTTGPRVEQFEKILCDQTGYKNAVAVSNGTAALHCACAALHLRPGDEVIVPAISFVASANCVLYCGATPVFCDVEEETMNIDPEKIEALITKNTVAILTVDFAGQLCKYERIRQIASENALRIIQDASHSYGVIDKFYGDLVTFSFHPVKNITTGEGGAVMTNQTYYSQVMRRFRSHGIDNNYDNRYLHYYDMIEMGYNYRITDIQCALGISQANKVDRFIKRRQELASLYTKLLDPLHPVIEPLVLNNPNAFHIFVIKVDPRFDRDELFEKLREYNIGVNVHYQPIYLHSFYKKKFGDRSGLCPVAEDIYQRIITLPLFPRMTDTDVQDVVTALNTIIKS